MKRIKRNVAILFVLPLGIASVLAKAAPAAAFDLHSGSNPSILIADRDDRDWRDLNWRDRGWRDRDWRDRDEHHDWRVWIPRHWQPGFLGIGGHWVEGHWEYRR